MVSTHAIYPLNPADTSLPAGGRFPETLISSLLLRNECMLVLLSSAQKLRFRATHFDRA
jgi:hypothetical protein